MILSVCRELAFVIMIQYPNIASDLINNLTESQCIEYNNKWEEIKAQIKQERNIRESKERQCLADFGEIWLIENGHSVRRKSDPTNLYFCLKNIK